MKRLFSAALRRASVLLLVTFFLTALIYYSLVLLTVGLSSDDNEVTRPASFCAVSNSRLLTVFVDTIAEFPGLIAIYFMIERVGRRRSIGLMFLICGMLLALVMIPFSGIFGHGGDILQGVLIFCARACSLAFISCLWVYAVEYFPTEVRGAGIGLIGACSRLGGILSPFLAQALFTVSRELAVGITFVSCIIAALLVLLLPKETSGEALLDTIPQDDEPDSAPEPNHTIDVHEGPLDTAEQTAEATHRQGTRGTKTSEGVTPKPQSSPSARQAEGSPAIPAAAAAAVDRMKAAMSPSPPPAVAAAAPTSVVVSEPSPLVETDHISPAPIRIIAPASSHFKLEASATEFPASPINQDHETSSIVLVDPPAKPMSESVASVSEFEVVDSPSVNNPHSPVSTNSAFPQPPLFDPAPSPPAVLLDTAAAAVLQSDPKQEAADADEDGHEAANAPASSTSSKSKRSKNKKRLGHKK
jgi:hypothetical protein